MRKGRGRRAVKRNAIYIDTAIEEEAVVENNEDAVHDKEVECQAAAIRALRDVEIEQLMTMLRLLRSYFSEEQLKVPVLQFFKEKLPNFLIVKNEENGQLEVKWKDEHGRLFVDQVGGGNINASLLCGLSMGYKDFHTAIPSLGAFEFSNRIKTSIFGAETLQIPGFNLEEPSDSHIVELQDKFQTPNVNNQRLSFGMTPKTLRLPKPGEMLLSVHGSPLGVYKEDNMEAINEDEDA